MKYCEHCGNQLVDEAVVCPKCGCAVGGKNSVAVEGNTGSALKTVAKVFMILGTVFRSFFYLIPLAWCLPMTIIYFGKIKRGESVSTGFKVCTLLFVDLIAGIVMLCDKD